MVKRRIKQPEIVQAFAQQLRNVRRSLGMSQQDLAFKAHVNIGYIGKLERAESAPGLDMVGRIAEALGVAPASLIGVVEQTVADPATAGEQVKHHIERLLTRRDAHALQAMAVVIGLVDNALARQNVRS